MNRFASIPAILFTAAVLSPTFYGQAISTNGGSIQGTITDPSGAAVPQAIIVVKGTDTGEIKTLKSDSAGFYSVGPLIPGNYTVTTTASGFQTLTVSTVIRTGTATPGSFKLTLGTSDQRIDVTAGALQVNTDQIGVQDVITRQQIDTLPINGRNILDIAQIEPGVVLQSGETFDPTKAGYSAISVSGVSGRTTRILLDGQDITDETVGTTIFNVTTGAVDRLPAQPLHPGRLRRSYLNRPGPHLHPFRHQLPPRTALLSVPGSPRRLRPYHRRLRRALPTQSVRRRYVGGPIIKDKLFFFADSERHQAGFRRLLAGKPNLFRSTVHRRRYLPHNDHRHPVPLHPGALPRHLQHRSPGLQRA